MIGAIEGGCLCAAIRYRITGAPLAQSLCHCKSCRSSPHVVRTFCGTCGTPLSYQHDERLDTTDVTTATLDRPDEFAPTREIWIEHKIPWETLNQNLRHYPRSSAE